MTKNRAHVNFIPEIKECFELGAEIQNAEVATVFVCFEAHINKLEVSIYYPYWVPDKNVDERLNFYTGVFEDMTEDECRNEYIVPVINRLKEILASAPQRKSDEEILAEQEKKTRLETFLKLKEEFSDLQIAS